MAEEKTSTTESVVNNTQVFEDASAAAGKKKKLPIILAAIAAAAVIIVALVLLLGNSGKGTSSDTEPATVTARMTDDGTAYIPLFDGTSLTINEEVEYAVQTKDRKHVVVLLSDGLLYVTDGQLENKTTVAENAEDFVVRNDGILYEDEDGVLYRVMFDDFESLEIATDVVSHVAKNTLSVLYATDEGKIYTLPATETEPSKVGSFDDEVAVTAISDDGQLSVWVEKNGSTLSICLNEGDTRTTLGQVDSKYNYTYATFTDDQKLAVITNSYSDRMWIKAVGEEPVEVKLTGEPYSNTVYTVNGYLSDEVAKKVQSFYFATESDSGNNLYYITVDGDRERVLSKIRDYTIKNGYIIYRDAEDNLYYGELNAADVVKEEKIASEVGIFEVTENGKYVYYTKDYEEETATLYCYKLGEEEPVKIASEIACYGGWNYGWTYNVYSTDGASVYYYKDLEEIENTYSDHGTLFLWTYGDDSSKKISSEVMTYSLSGGLSSGEVKKNGFMFQKYVSVDSDGNVFTNWMYYNGKDAAKVASDVID